jgi:hypothetical protein
MAAIVDRYTSPSPFHSRPATSAPVDAFSTGVLFAYFIAATIVLVALGVTQYVGIVAFVIGFVPFGIWILYRRYSPPPLE